MKKYESLKCYSSLVLCTVSQRGPWRQDETVLQQ